MRFEYWAMVLVAGSVGLVQFTEFPRVSATNSAILTRLPGEIITVKPRNPETCIRKRLENRSPFPGVTSRTGSASQSVTYPVD
jgi:hypothetical protein